MLHAIHLALLQFWAWANEVRYDRWDHTAPLMTPVQLAELFMISLTAALIGVYLFSKYDAWQERRIQRMFRQERRLKQILNSK
jgi:hypothetical protein